MEASRKSDDENAQKTAADRWSRLAEAIERLGSVRTLDPVVEILRSSARRIADADGIAIVLPDRGQCHYIAEDAMAPLWAGQRFPQDQCISGTAMTTRQTIVIPDIMADPRIPHAAYDSTFVRSMAMVPIGRPEPVAAIGAYWSHSGDPDPEAVILLEALSRAATTAIENGRLLASLEELNSALERRVAERTAELERTQAIARQAQKMEVIGQLTGNVAHDFNNLLTPIMGSLDITLNSSGLSAGVARSASIAMDAAERARLLVQRLLAFARRQPLVPKAVDINGLLNELRGLLASSVGSRIALVINGERGLPAALADPHQLELALINLAVNARDAMPDGGSLTLSVSRGEGRERPAELAGGEFLCIMVRDEGTGMDEQVLAQAIEPFFSTKGTAHGTGLGLSMVHGLAAQLGGALQLFSTVGVGTEILLWLPAAGGDSRQRQKSPADEAISGTILLIDDEPLVRLGTAEMIAAIGYEVIEAGCAREGLDLIENGLDPAIVITDHVMPGMSGAELCLRLRAQRPATALMIVSGYQGVDLVAPDIVRLSKPFRQADLIAGIAAARRQVPAT